MVEECAVAEIGVAHVHRGLCHATAHDGKEGYEDYGAQDDGGNAARLGSVGVKGCQRGLGDAVGHPCQGCREAGGDAQQRGHEADGHAVDGIGGRVDIIEHRGIELEAPERVEGDVGDDGDDDGRGSDEVVEGQQMPQERAAQRRTLPGHRHDAEQQWHGDEVGRHGQIHGQAMTQDVSDIARQHVLGGADGYEGHLSYCECGEPQKE